MGNNGFVNRGVCLSLPKDRTDCGKPIRDKSAIFFCRLIWKQMNCHFVLSNKLRVSICWS